MASVMIPPQVLLGLENSWTQVQIMPGISQPSPGNSIVLYIEGYRWIFHPGSLLIATGAGLYTDPNIQFSGGLSLEGAITQIIGDAPAQSTLSVTSGTVYQNTTNRYLSIDVAVYAATAGTAGTMAFARGASSTPSTIWTRMVSAATTSTATDVQPIRIPPGFYWSLTLSGATFGTITQTEE